MDLKTAKDLEPSPEVRKDWTFLLCIFLLLAGLSYFLLPGLCCGGGLTQAREGTASSLILQLSQAAKLYELDYAGGRVARRGRGGRVGANSGVLFSSVMVSFQESSNFL